MIENIRANAEIVIAQMGQLSGFEFGYNQESVEWLEGYIERQRESGTFEDEATRSKLASVLGSYLGECIVRVHGGSWQQTEHGWAIVFDQGNAAFPFAKIQKQMENGLEDGIASFFNTIPLLCAFEEPREDKKPWWKVW